MTPSVAIHPYTLHCEFRKFAKPRRVENIAGERDLNGEHALHQDIHHTQARQARDAHLSRRETDSAVSIWDCVLPDAAFAAQAIGQALPHPAWQAPALAYVKKPASTAMLLDRRA